MTDAMIQGVGMTAFGRHPDRSVRSLAEEAVRAALADAGLQARDVGAVIFGNAVQGAMEGQFGIRGQIALRDMDFDAVPIINVENACASASTALNLAVMHVTSGACDVALAVGAEKMVHPDTARSMDAFEGSWERADREGAIARLTDLGKGMPVAEEVRARETPHTVFMDVYSSFARSHMARFGTTERQMAVVASKNHAHSVENPLSQYRKPFTVDEVLNARLIAWPLTLPMCSPISDGAAAAVVVSARKARELGLGRAVKVRAIRLGNGGRRAPDDLEAHISRRTAQAAYEAAGLGPEDVDVAECHDATAFGEIQQTELLGFCEIGAGGPLAESGATALGGRIPFNPSGGLESRGHPIGATGLAQIHELVTQLRGEAGPRQVDGARIALAENGGGLMGVEEAAVSIALLERA
ncbi:MAG: Acetyl-CoA acetyltransferase [Rhodobacteraceae bacterium HLUCCA24]|nr:MAG: Acetyl-CoA acetyltransferase [Rhodobacteraceae bacterium HLUCCA24]